MALKFAVENIEDIPETVRDQYVERDGKWRLDIDGLEDTTGLRTALDSERKSRRDFEKKLKRFEALGKSDEEISTLIQNHEETERKKAEAAGDHAKILQQHREKWDKERSGLEAERDAARKAYENAVISSSLMTALTKANATEEGLDLLPERLTKRIRFVSEDGEIKTKILEANSENAMPGSGKDGFATYDDLVKEALHKWPSLFRGSGRTGSGMLPNNGAGRSGKSMSRADFERLPVYERGKVLRSGITVTD